MTHSIHHNHTYTQKDIYNKKMPLTLYTNPISQPSRTVWWLMTWKMPAGSFNVTMTNPGAKKAKAPMVGSRSPTFLENTDGVGTIPALELESGQWIYESNAIMAYLADKYGWEDLYPKNLEERAKINQYFNWHHGNVRKVTTSRFAPLVRLDLKFNDDLIASDYKMAQRALQNVEARLGKSKFICGESLSLADFAASGDILQMLDEFCGMADFSNYPNILRWSEDMKQLPKFDEMHKALVGFGNKVFKKNFAKAGRSKL